MSVSPENRPVMQRSGFTLIELIIVVGIMMILGAVAYPRVAARITGAQANNAAQVVASDLREAIAMTVRQGRPMKIEWDASTKTLRLRDRATNAIIRTRKFGVGTEFPVRTVSASASSVFLFPNRLASSPLTLTFATPNGSAAVVMTRATIVSVQ